MSEELPEVTMADICIMLRDSYTENGVAMWLNSVNYDFGARPIDACETLKGRKAVYDYVQSLAR